MIKASPISTITVESVGKTFSVKTQDVTVLTDINFTVSEGQFLVIFGPSGCGKSTLLHTLLGLEEPTRGEILFDKKSLYKQMNEDQRADLRKQSIGMVYQQPNWIKSLTVRENVMFALRLNSVSSVIAHTRANKALEQVEMLDWADYIPTELSSGQQQRVALARAIVTDPTFIIADEPTGNLDFESGQKMMELLQHFNKEGKTVIMVTHDLEYLGYASRALEMLDGKIVQDINQPAKFVVKSGNHLKRGSDQTVASGSDEPKQKVSIGD